MSEQQKPDKVDGALAFQTMADALHLQKSVIGKKVLKKIDFFAFSYKHLPFQSFVITCGNVIIRI